MKVIGFTGLPRVGKTTAANYLAENETTRLESFADPLKKAASIIYPQVGEDWYNEKKDEVNEELGLTPRYILQKLGTEVGRGIHEDTWILNMKSRIYEHSENGISMVVIDDVRFPNELEVCGTVIHLRRDGCEPKYIKMSGEMVIHPSDSYDKDFYDKAEYRFSNNSTIPDLQWKIYHLLYGS